MTIVPSKLGSKNGGRPSRHSAWLHDAVAELCPQVRDGDAEGAGQPLARDGDRLVVLLLLMLMLMLMLKLMQRGLVSHLLEMETDW